MSKTNCLICGNDVFAKPSHREKGAGKFCSRKCAGIGQTKSRTGILRTSIIKTCIVCGKNRIIKLSHKDTDGTFCSVACMSLNYKEALKGENNHNWKGGMVSLNCLNCSREFKVIQSLKEKRKYCSWECSSIHRVLNMNLNHTSKRSKGGKRIDLENRFFRSSWEANYARYLNFLIDNKSIKSWEFESERFEFESIKRGNRFYIIDFKIINNDDSCEYHEVKGYMDATSKTKLNRMAKFYPHIKVIVIGKKEYNEIKNKLSMIIKNWE